MRFSAKWFALAALSVYYNYTEIIKTLSFDLLTEKKPYSDQTNKITCASSEDWDQLGIHPIWSESLLCAQWVAEDPRFLDADSEDWSNWAETGPDPGGGLRVFSPSTLLLVLLHTDVIPNFHPRPPTPASCPEPYQLSGLWIRVCEMPRLIWVFAVRMGHFIVFFRAAVQMVLKIGNMDVIKRSFYSVW